MYTHQTQAQVCVLSVTFFYLGRLSPEVASFRPGDSDPSGPSQSPQTSFRPTELRTLPRPAKVSNKLPRLRGNL